MAEPEKVTIKWPDGGKLEGYAVMNAEPAQVSPDPDGVMMLNQAFRYAFVAPPTFTKGPWHRRLRWRCYVLWRGIKAKLFRQR